MDVCMGVWLGRVVGVWACGCMSVQGVIWVYECAGVWACGCMSVQGCGGVGMWVYECAGCDMGV